MRTHALDTRVARSVASKPGAWHVLPFSTVAGAALCMIAIVSPGFAAQFTLRWSDNSTNESGFRVERATGTAGAFSEIGRTGANVASYIDANLPASTLYRYRVRAFNAAGLSGYSNIVSGTTPSGGGANTAPTLSAIGNRTTNKDTSTGAVSFTVGDAETSAANLSLSAASSNTTLIPTSRISFGGSGANRTVTLTPAANASGSATITVRVSDGSLSTSRSFTVTVTAVNDRPTISNIGDRTISPGGTSGPIAFTIGDIETAPASLRLSTTSSNQSLVSNSRLTLGGSGSNRTLTVSPQSGATGTASISVSVSDGSATVADSFVVTVRSATSNTPPTISGIAAQSIAANTQTAALPFTIGDAQTSVGSLTLTKGSSNTGLVPPNNIRLAGSGANRTVTVTPTSNTTGWSTIYLKVSDGSLNTTISFVVNVSLALTYGDIGSPTLAGSQSINGSTVTMQAAGTDIGGTKDQFRYGRAYVTGDAEMTVRVAGLSNTNSWAKAGLMFRANLSAAAPFVMISATPTNGISLQYRTAAGGASAVRRTEAGAAPEWLRLVRVNDTFYAFHSEDGRTWDFVESVTVDLPGTTWGGLAVTSRAAGTRTRAVFDSLRLD